MTISNINAKPFDSGTELKLDLFERYAESWLPVFVAKSEIFFPEVNIVDFCAGSGTDSKGAHGSPLRLLKVIEGQKRYLPRQDVKLSLILSDNDDVKISKLRTAVAENASAIITDHVKIDIETSEFARRFESLLPRLESKQSANLLIVDQYGVKLLTEERFLQITNLSTTDFLFFVNASTFHRYADQPWVKRYLDFKRAEDYNRAHIAVCDSYRALIPKNRPYFLAPFSIKKGSNIYGVIFGTQKPLGMIKFLKVAWKLDGLTGCANFDIFNEGIFEVPNLLPGLDVSKKVTHFEDECEKRIRSGEIRSEWDLLMLCFQHGVTPGHAGVVIKKLIKDKVIVCTENGVTTNRWSVPNEKGQHSWTLKTPLKVPAAA